MIKAIVLAILFSMVAVIVISASTSPPSGPGSHGEGIAEVDMRHHIDELEKELAALELSCRKM